jgi:hypothetical protein
MCDERVLQNIYEFLKLLLKTEFTHICQKLILNNGENIKDKKKKIRKKMILVIDEEA